MKPKAIDYYELPYARRIYFKNYTGVKLEITIRMIAEHEFEIILIKKHY